MTSKRQSLFGDLAAAFLLLSRIPVTYQFPKDKPPDFIQSLWAFPLVGFLIGAMGGLALTSTKLLGLPGLVSGALCVSILAISSGAMHEDGLADTVDGFGGGRTTSDKLRIMHDSHIGSYGTLVLCLSTLIRTTLFAAILDTDMSIPMIIILVSTIVAGARGLVLVGLFLFPIAAGAKLAKLTGRPAVGSLITATALWFFPLTYVTNSTSSFVSTLAASVVCILLGKLAMLKIKGINGDVMGAMIVLAEIMLTACIYITFISPQLIGFFS